MRSSFLQSIGNALCATGFGESVSGLFVSASSPAAEYVERALAASVVILLTVVNVAGVKWVVRLQFLLLVALMLGAADFAIGSFTHTDPGRHAAQHRVVAVLPDGLDQSLF